MTTETGYIEYISELLYKGTYRERKDIIIKSKTETFAVELGSEQVAILDLFCVGDTIKIGYYRRSNKDMQGACHNNFKMVFIEKIQSEEINKSRRSWSLNS